VSSPSDRSPDSRSESISPGERLDSWKAIAAYLGREIRTVQRWEKTESLPIHRHHHAKQGSVYAFTSELRDWQNSRRNLMAASEIQLQKKNGEPLQPAIQIVAIPTPVEAAQQQSRPVRAILSALGLCLVTLFAVTMFERHDSHPNYEPVFLTTYGGRQYSPSLSPDGSSVAYSWRRSPRDHLQIYTEVTGSSRPVRLTEEPGNAFRPAWSPDGKLIAFLRAEGNSQTGLWLYSVSNHSMWRIRQLPGSYEQLDMKLSWTPHDDGLIVPESNSPSRKGGLFYVPVAGLNDVRLTHPAGGQGDPNSVISLDGRQLVFTRFFSSGVSHLCTVALSAEHKPVGEETPIRWSGFQESSASEPSFLGASGDLLFLASTHGQRRIWRSHNFEAPVLAGIPAAKISGLAVSATGHKLAYSVDRSDSNVWKLDVRALLENHPAEPEAVVASTELDQRPQVSPDGTQLALESDRSGADEIWTFNLKTEENFQVTHFNSRGVGSPSWSPDGKKIVFDARLNGQAEIYTISAFGGTPRQLTFGTSTNFLPTWSRDGRWIYFSSSRSGTSQIWRLPATGGEPEQITQKGGLDCRMSDDGAFLYYVNVYNIGGLWRVPSGGGQELQIISAVVQRAFALSPKGVFFIPPLPADREELRYLQFGTETPRSLYAFKSTLIPPFSFDGRFLYFSQYDTLTSNLMLVDHFR